MNIKEIYDQYGIRYVEYGEHHHVTRGFIQTDCPFCNVGPENYRLGFNIRNKFYNCWSCGPKRLVDALMALTQSTFSEVKELLETFDPLLLSDQKRPKIVRDAVKLPANLKDMQQAHKDYLMRRGLNPKTIAALWGVKGIGVSAYLQWRLWIPVFFDMEIISWTTRAIHDSATKRYIAAAEEDEKLPGKSVLYGEDYCKDSIIICEGPVDVWKIGKGAVATLGTSYSESQVLRMIQYPNRIICFDSTPDGQARAHQLMDKLAPFKGRPTRNVILDAKDAGSAKEKELKQLRKMLR